jgi:hypothetical protein
MNVVIDPLDRGRHVPEWDYSRNRWSARSRLRWLLADRLSDFSDPFRRIEPLSSGCHSSSWRGHRGVLMPFDPQRAAHDDLVARSDDRIDPDAPSRTSHCSGGSSIRLIMAHLALLVEVEPPRRQRPPSPNGFHNQIRLGALGVLAVHFSRSSPISQRC